MTKTAALEIASKFVRDYVRTGRQWDTGTIESYLPPGMRFRDGASYAGAPTMTDIAGFIAREAVTSSP